MTEVFIVLQVRKILGFSPSEDHNFFRMLNYDSDESVDESEIEPVYELNFATVGLAGILPVLTNKENALEIAKDEKYILTATVNKEGFLSCHPNQSNPAS